MSAVDRGRVIIPNLGSAQAREQLSDKIVSLQVQLHGEAGFKNNGFTPSCNVQGNGKCKDNGTDVQRYNVGYRLHPAVFGIIKDMFEETYGFFLHRDVFADRHRTLLAEYGFPKTGDIKPVYIDVKWDQLQQVIQWISKEKIIAVLIVPRWDKHIWYKTFTQRASHRLVLPVGAKLFEEKKGQSNYPYQMDCFFLMLGTTTDQLRE